MVYRAETSHAATFVKDHLLCALSIVGFRPHGRNCRPAHGASEDIVFVAQLQPVGAQERTDCSDQGAQSMAHRTAVHMDCWPATQCALRLGSCRCKIWPGLSSTGRRPSATCTGQASSSSPGPDNTCHRTSERHDRGAPSARQIYDIMPRLMSCAAAGC